MLLRAALTDEEIASAPWSPDSTCPNCQYGLYADDPDQYVWNPQGQNLIEEAFDIPIFAVNPVSGVPLQVYNQIMTVSLIHMRSMLKPGTEPVVARACPLMKMRVTRITRFTAQVLNRSCGQRWIRRHA